MSGYRAGIIIRRLRVQSSPDRRLLDLFLLVHARIIVNGTSPPTSWDS